MFRIRRFEQTSFKYYQQGKMGGFLHLYTGQESVAVGTALALGGGAHVAPAATPDAAARPAHPVVFGTEESNKRLAEAEACIGEE